MFTEQHRHIILTALDDRVAANNRAKAKARNPKFQTIYDEDTAEIRHVQEIVRAWATQHDDKPKAK